MKNLHVYCMKINTIIYIYIQQIYTLQKNGNKYIQLKDTYQIIYIHRTNIYIARKNGNKYIQ